jgi:hypothetical protein
VGVECGAAPVVGRRGPGIGVSGGPLEVARSCPCVEAQGDEGVAELVGIERVSSPDRPAQPPGHPGHGVAGEPPAAQTATGTTSRRVPWSQSPIPTL